MKVETYWKKLEKIGWLKEHPAEWIPTLRAQLEEASEWDPKRLYLGLTSGGFDAECIEEYGPGTTRSYYGVLGKYQRASFDRFAPKEIEDYLDMEAEKARVTFKLKRRKFSRGVVFDSDYFEGGIHDLINRALAQTGFKERFYMLPSRDQFVRLVFVRPATYRKALAERLIPKQR